MKLSSLKLVLAMTAVLGFAFVGISCKPKSDDGDGEKPAAEDSAKKDGGDATKDGGDAKKDDATEDGGDAKKDDK